MAADLSHVWEVQTINRRCLSILKEMLYKDYMKFTLENIQNSELYPNLRTYKLFKQEYKLENYLTQIKYLRYIKVLI